MPGEGVRGMLETICEFPTAHAPALRREMERVGWREGGAWRIGQSEQGGLLTLRVRMERPCADLIIRDAKKILAREAG